MEKTVTNQNFVDWMGEYFGYGYGSGENFWFPALKQFFEILEEERRYDYKNVEEKFGGLSGWLLINTLCGADILEYGTSPRYGWLTQKGELLRDYLKGKTTDDLIEVYNNGEVSCGQNFCNCGNSEDDQKCKNNPLFYI